VHLRGSVICKAIAEISQWILQGHIHYSMKFSLCKISENFPSHKKKAKIPKDSTNVLYAG